MVGTAGENGPDWRCRCRVRSRAFPKGDHLSHQDVVARGRWQAADNAVLRRARLLRKGRQITPQEAGEVELVIGWAGNAGRHQGRCILLVPRGAGCYPHRGNLGRVDAGGDESSRVSGAGRLDGTGVARVSSGWTRCRVGVGAWI